MIETPSALSESMSYVSSAPSTMRFKENAPISGISSLSKHNTSTSLSDIVIGKTEDGKDIRTEDVYNAFDDMRAQMGPNFLKRYASSPNDAPTAHNTDGSFSTLSRMSTGHSLLSRPDSTRSDGTGFRVAAAFGTEEEKISPADFAE